MKERKFFQYLPTWQVRQSIWLGKLTLELKDKGYPVKSSKDSFSEGLESLYIDAGIDAPDATTFSNWFELEIYPKGVKLDHLCMVSHLSRKWLKTDEWEHSLSDSSHESLHDLCNAIDYFICSVQPNIKPTLFNKDEQDSFSRRCLDKIAKYWNISSIHEDKGYSLRRKIQDVSLSKLKTHGYSAIPFYLCSVIADDGITDSELYAWYVDLLCSTLIVSANFYRKNIEFDKSYPQPYSDMPEYFGTCPNLLSAVGAFLFKDSSDAEKLFEDASIHGNFDEIKDSERLLKRILSGNRGLQEELNNLGCDYAYIISAFHTRGIQTSFLPEILKDKISCNRNHRFIETTNLVSHDSIVFNLIPGTFTSSTKVEKVVNGEAPKAVDCRYFEDVEPDQYSWGYGGRSVQILAYSLLSELFNKNYRVIDYIPEPFQIELIVFKILSRLYPCFRYSITSEQILNALKEPIVYREKKPPKLSYSLDDYSFVGSR